MRTTITLDDDLLEKAMRLTGIKDRTPLIRESLKAITARESARRLALLGGSMPELQLPPRRRPEPDPESEPGISNKFAPEQVTEKAAASRFKKPQKLKQD